MSKCPLKFREKSRFGAFYTGNSQGHADICLITGRLFLTYGDEVKILNQNNGQTIHTISLEGDLVSSLALSPDGNHLVVSSKLGFLKQYDTSSFELVRTWRSTHVGPVRLLKYDSTSTFLASGGSDGTVKVWDIIRKFCTHNLKQHTGLIQTLQFHPSDLTLFVSCDDHTIKRWSLKTSSVTNIYSSHVSTVTSLAIIENHLISVGRDSVILIWDLAKQQANQEEPDSTLAAYEPIEALRERDGLIYTVGQRGSVRSWSMEKELRSENRRNTTPAEPDLISCHNLLLNTNNGIVSIDNNHNIHFLGETLERNTTLNGNLEEVLDACWVKIDDKDYFVAATNSPVLQIRGLESGHSKLLEGHTGAILSVDTYKKDQTTIVSCSRDQSIRVWKFSDNEYTCSAVLTGHVAAVTCAKFLSNQNCIISCSEDKAVKCWRYKGTTFECCWTKIDHAKAINSVGISPNDKFVCTASADKTMCMYDIETGNKVTVFEGHRKGVWTVQFSPVDQVVASGSADGDIRLWDVRESTCVKSLEGSDSSVLSLVWKESGDQLLSSGSDGVIRIWDVARAETTDVLEAHDQRCWSLVKIDENILSSGADGQVILWEDVSEAVWNEEREKMVEEQLNLQKMNNMIQTKQYAKALQLAIKLGRPGNALTTIRLLSLEELDEVVSKLSMTHRMKLFEFCSYWNRNSKTAYSAQITIKSIFSCVKLAEFLSDFATGKNVEIMLPFTDRYRRRIDNLRIQSRFSNFLLGTIKVAPRLNETGEEEEMSE